MDFHLEADFIEFIVTLSGKWRMVVRIDSGEVLRLKVVKELRKELRGSLEPGMRLALSGTEERIPFSKELKRTVLEAQVISLPGGLEPVCVECPIRVCAKKNCWKNGGKEVFAVIQGELEDAGLAGEIEVKAVGCLDNCKRGPNVLHGKRFYEYCSPERAAGIVAGITARRVQPTR